MGLTCVTPYVVLCLHAENFCNRLPASTSGHICSGRREGCSATGLHAGLSIPGKTLALLVLLVTAGKAELSVWTGQAPVGRSTTSLQHATFTPGTWAAWATRADRLHPHRGHARLGT